MSDDLTYQVEKLINSAILELLRKNCCNNIPYNQNLDITKISIGDNNLIDIFLKLDYEVQQIIKQQLTLVIKSIKPSKNNEKQNYIPEQNQSFRKIGWLRKESELHECYKIFDQYAVTRVTEEIFIRHFTGSENSGQRIPWYEKKICLPYIFQIFSEKEIIPPHDNLFVLLSEHFCDSKGKYLDPGNLRKNYGQAYSYKMFSNFDYLMKALNALFKIKE